MHSERRAEKIRPSPTHRRRRKGTPRPPTRRVSSPPPPPPPGPMPPAPPSNRSVESLRPPSARQQQERDASRARGVAPVHTAGGDPAREKPDARRPPTSSPRCASLASTRAVTLLTAPRTPRSARALQTSQGGAQVRARDRFATSARRGAGRAGGEAERKARSRSRKTRCRRRRACRRRGARRAQRAHRRPSARGTWTFGTRCSCAAR